MINPYVGPKWFEEADQDRFFGREREARDLLAQVVSERLVLFYAQSGAGKSSLLRARLIPNLRQQGFEVLPIGRVSGELPQGIVATQVNNIFVFNLLLSLNTEEGSHALPTAQLVATSLADFLAGENPSSDASAPSNEREDTDYLPTVLIIDQFEELLTTNLHRWQDRADFFNQLRTALERFPNLWVVLTLREDYLAGLDPYAHLVSNRLSTRYYMQRLGLDAASAAVQRPAAEIGKRPFAPGVAEALVDNLRRIKQVNQQEEQLGQFVEPVQLQVVCYQLWENLRGDRETKDKETGSSEIAPVPSLQSPITPNYITESDLKALAKGGDVAQFVDQALSGYYESALGKLLAADPTLSERRVRDWFSTQLITKAGTRNLLPEEGEGVAGLPCAAVRLLQQQFLVRAEPRAGGIWYELTHDRFVEPILASNRTWELAQNNPLSAATRLWLDQGRDPRQLLSGQPLRHAQAFAQTQSSLISADEAAFLQASVEAETEAARLAEIARLQASAEAERHRIRNLWRVVSVVAALALLALIATGWALRNANQAAAAESQARFETEKAQQAQATAEAANQTAQQNAASRATAEAQAHSEAENARQSQAAAEVARQEADVERQKTAELSRYIRADQLAQTALVVDNQEQLPQRALLLGVEAAHLISPPIASTMKSLHNLLGRIGGVPYTGHEAPVTSVAFSPDGKLLASASWDTTIRLWQVAQPTSEPLVLRGHYDEVNSVAFSPDGKLLASASRDKTIRLWQVAEPTSEPLILRRHHNNVWAVAFSPDGKLLASASEDRTIRLWQVAQPSSEPVVLRGHDADVYSVVFSPDGKLLASASWDKTVRLWQVAQPTSEPLVLSGHTDNVYTVAFSPDGKLLASASNDHTIRLWQVSQPTSEPLVLRGHDGAVTSIVFSLDSKMLASASLDNTIRLWQVAQPTSEPLILRGHDSAVYSVVFSPDNKLLASASFDKTVRLWQVAQPTNEPLILRGHDAEVYSVAFSPNSKLLASASSDNTINLWQAAQPTSEPLVLRGHNDAVYSVAFSPDGKLLASASRDKTIRLWQVTQPTSEPLVLRGHDDYVSAVAFSPDGKLLASASFDHTIRLWQVAQPSSEPLVLRGHDAPVYSVAFSPDGKLLASASRDNTIRLWQVVQPSSEPRILTGNDNYVYSVAFSPDGKLLASASWDMTIRLWQVTQPTSKPLVLRGHNYYIWAVAFSPDGKLLASASSDKTIRLWQVAQPGSEPIVLRGHDDEIMSVAFSPDGKLLASASSDTTIRLWIVNSTDLLSTACATAGRNLSEEEWLRYFPENEYRRTCADQPLPSSFRSEAEGMARRGELSAALSAYARMLELDPRLNFDPQQEVNHQFAQTVVLSATQLATSGEITASLAAISQALQLDSNLEINKITWNSICWKGALAGLAEQVMFACENAVAPGPYVGFFRDSRGLARALTGNPQGATEDFEAFIQWAKENIQGTELIPEREAWIAALKAGKNPFTPEVLQQLRNE